MASAACADEAEAGEVGEVLGRAGEDRADARGSPRRRGRPGRAGRGRGSRRRSGSVGPTTRRASRTVTSSWPRWTRVGPGEPGEVGAVVDDEPGPGLRGEDADLAGPAEPLAVGQALLAELDHVGAAGQGLADDPGQVAERRQAADEDHQPGVAQRPAGGQGGQGQLLQGVDVVAEDLEPAGEPDVDELGVLFQRAEGLGGPLEVGGRTARGFSRACSAAVMMWVPTSPRVSREPIRRLGVEPAEGLGQAVADLLEPAGQAGVVEGEPGVVLDDPEPLAGAVGRGVEDPAEVDRPAPARPGPAGRCRRPAGSARSRRRRPRPSRSRRASSARPGAGEHVGDRRRRPRAGRRAGARCRPAGPGRSARACAAASPSAGAERGRRAATGAGGRVGPSSSASASARGDPERRPGRRSGSRPNSASSSAARLSARRPGPRAGRPARRPPAPRAGPGLGPVAGPAGRRR